VKLHKILAIKGMSIGLTKEDVRLDAANPGRASFTVQSVEALKGRVTLDVGYKDRTLQRRFIGYVERCTAANAVQRVLFCRELAAVLTNSLPLNLRHVDLRTVLAQVREQAGLRFHVPDRPDASMKAPYFYSLVAACQATDSLARVFSIPDFTWHQMGNDKVFVGNWGDSFYGGAALAGLRSGTTINHGERITRVTLVNDQMALRWQMQSPHWRAPISRTHRRLSLAALRPDCRHGRCAGGRRDLRRRSPALRCGLCGTRRGR
jgi:hypothetical protein